MKIQFVRRGVSSFTVLLTAVFAFVNYECYAFTPLTTSIRAPQIKTLSLSMKTTNSKPLESESLEDEGREVSNFEIDLDDLHLQKQSLYKYTSENDEPEYEYSFSIDNEIALQEFITVINKVDKGIVQEEHLDFGRLFNILVEKSFDTVEDASLMFRRKMAESDAVLNPRDADAMAEWNDETQNDKPRVLVIGTGWGAHAFIKCIDTDKFRILVVSPINHFVFTPMLASSSVGTTEVRSIVESTRDSNPFVSFLEGKGLDMDVEAKVLKVKLGEDTLTNDRDENDDILSSDSENEIIDIPYDIAVYAAGVGPILSSNRTPGLSKDNVYFLKSVNDAVRLRSAVIDLLEKASQPGYTDEERKRLLTFVVVGGGPTGTEYCGELSDFLNDITGRSGTNRSIVKRAVAPFASLAKYTSVILLQSAPDLLPMFEENLRKSARLSLENEGVKVLTNTMVSSIKGRDRIVIANSGGGEGKSENIVIDCGIIVWAAGTKPIQLTENIMSNIDHVCDEKGFETLPSSLSYGGRVAVDKWQRVIGAPAGSMFAIGDASGTVGEGTKRLPQTAQVAAQQGAYLARLLNRGYDLKGSEFDSSTSTRRHNDALTNSDDLLFLGAPFHHDGNESDTTEKNKLRRRVKAKPFTFLNLGQLAYTGGGEALSQVQIGDKQIFSKAGSVGFLLWKSVYIVKQVSTKTRLLVLFDWFKTKVFGRDVTRM